MENKKVLTVIGLLFVLVLGLLVGFSLKDTGYSEEALNTAIGIKVSEVSEGYDITLSEKETELNDLKASLEAINLKLVEETEESVNSEEVVTTSGSLINYLIDELNIGNDVDETLSDREVSKLLDSEVEFDGEDYELEEVIELSNMKVLVNEEDFESVPHLMVYEDAIKYNVVFDEDLNTSLIDEDETLSFSFLGEEVEISDWDSTSVTFTKGNEIYMNDGESITLGEDVIVLEMVLEDKIKLSVNGEIKTIKKGETAKFVNLEVYVKDIDFSGYAGGYFATNLVVGEDVENVVDSGDEYSEDSIWEYVIDSNSIGIVLKEDFKELDDDYKPLASGESLCLPNDYVCFRYDGFEAEDTEELSFELDDGFVEINGEFQSGLEDYDKILVNKSGIYDEDEVLISSDRISIGSSDVELVLGTNNIKIKDIKLNYDLNVLRISNVENSKDYDVRTDFGIKIESPEDSMDDEEWSMVVPYEQLSNTISVL